MTLTARATKSIRIRDIAGQRSGAIGFQKLVFAHQAQGVESTIDLTAMVVPAGWGSQGFLQPSLAQLLAAQIRTYHTNLELKSSVHGPLTEFDDYNVTSNSLVTLKGWTLQAGEIITCSIDFAPQPGLIAVDNVARPATGVLLAGQTSFSVGYPFEVNKFPTTQIGAVMVTINGIPQMRCVGNQITGDGNYIEVGGSNGAGNVIQFKDAPFDDDRAVMVIPLMAAAVAPSGSPLAYVEALNAVVQLLVQDMVAVTGNDPSRYSASPSAVDLSSFGARVTALDTILLKSANYTALAGDQLMCDTLTVGAFQVTLPATPTVGQRVTVMDAKKYFGTNNLTVGRNGNNIDGAAQDYLCDVDGLKVEFIYVDATTGWAVYKSVP